MLKWIKDNFETVDLSDTRLLMFGLLLLFIPIFWLFFFSGIREEKSVTTRISFANPGKQSAFNITAKAKSTASPAAKNLMNAVRPPDSLVEDELNRVWSKIRSSPRRVVLPPDVKPDVRQMIEAEEDELLAEANALLDQTDFPAAEKAYKAAINSAGSNQFKELFAWGGLMQIYQLSGNVEKFREAFANYAKTAQSLQHIYGPLADNVARAYEMFDQLARVDSGKVREYLTRASLTSGQNVSYEQFMNAINKTKQWYPANLESPEPRRPEMLQPNDQ